MSERGPWFSEDLQHSLPPGDLGFVRTARVPCRRTPCGTHVLLLPGRLCCFCVVEEQGLLWAAKIVCVRSQAARNSAELENVTDVRERSMQELRREQAVAALRLRDSFVAKNWSALEDRHALCEVYGYPQGAGRVESQEVQRVSSNCFEKLLVQGVPSIACTFFKVWTCTAF